MLLAIIVTLLLAIIAAIGMLGCLWNELHRKNRKKFV